MTRPVRLTLTLSEEERFALERLGQFHDRSLASMIRFLIRQEAVKNSLWRFKTVKTMSR